MKTYLRRCAGCGLRRWLAPGKVCRTCLGVPKKAPIRPRKMTTEERIEAIERAAASRIEARIKADPEIMARLAAAKQGRLI